MSETAIVTGRDAKNGRFVAGKLRLAECFNGLHDVDDGKIASLHQNTGYFSVGWMG